MAVTFKPGFNVAGKENLTPHLYTVGFSNHSTDNYIELLNTHGIELLIDVRSSPYSSYQPHTNRPNIESALKAAGIDYLWGGQYLGGKKGPSITDDNFIAKMEKVIQLAKTKRVALSCSEGQPNTCHRAYKLSAYLQNTQKIITNHILPDGKIIAHDVFSVSKPARWFWYEFPGGNAT